jgi:hypothetical protein
MRKERERKKERYTEAQQEKRDNGALRIPGALSNHEMQSVSAQLSLSLFFFCFFFTLGC